MGVARARLRGLSSAAALVTALCLLPFTSASAAPAFPEGYEEYHTYAEMVAELDAVVADHPGIVRKFSIGRSYQGRELWAAKISDNVNLNENEPEVLISSLIHGREHLTVEMNLYLLHLLADNYGSDSRITSIVRTREIFLVFMLNPDGGEYDIASGEFRSWRKNRQPVPNSSQIGVDPNRNFGFNWGCCGGGSNDPKSGTYRGPRPWFAPETVALRDFVRSRVVDGRQQLRLAISLHTVGGLVLWPYGYTKTNVPPTMTADDRAAFVAMSQAAAELNGYTAQQGSDLYIYDGDQHAWIYYEQRIFELTLELGPVGSQNFYPTADRIAPLTRVNRTAVLYLLEQADCPWRSASLVTRCGPINDDFEVARGWQVNPNGTDTATGGRWSRGVPQKTETSAGVKQKARTASGQAALVTGLSAGSSANANDVDGGLTSTMSPSINLGTGAWTLEFKYTFAHDARSSSADLLRVRIVVGSTRTTLFTVVGAATNRNAAWTEVTRSLNSFAGQTVRVLIEAQDGGSDSLVEASIDDLRVYATPGVALTALYFVPARHGGAIPV